MTVLYIDSIGTTSLLSTTSTLEDTVEDSDTRSTTISGLASSLTSSMSEGTRMNVYMANQYVDSLSDQQLVQMIDLLDAKEDSILSQTTYQEEQPKVFQKTSKV